MINRLIDMNHIISIPKENKISQINENATVQDYAIAFINGLSDTQRERFKKMLENKIECGISVAKSYGIDYNKFITEVKKLLKVDV